MLKRFFEALSDGQNPDYSGSAEPTAAAPIPFTIVFQPPESSAQTVDNEAMALHTPRHADPMIVSESLCLPTPRPSISIIGGAGNMSEAALRQVHNVIEHSLVQFADRHNLNVIDGGTDAGVMSLLGECRAKRNYQFPLIGVAPNALVRYPGFENPQAQADLERRHSHFALTTGAEWGDESDMLAGMAYALSGGDSPSHFPTLGIVINGGKVVMQEAYARMTGGLRYPLLVLEGSGRTADEIAAAYHAGSSDDPLLAGIIASDKLHVKKLSDGTASLTGWLEDFFAST